MDSSNAERSEKETGDNFENSCGGDFSTKECIVVTPGCIENSSISHEETDANCPVPLGIDVVELGTSDSEGQTSVSQLTSSSSSTIGEGYDIKIGGQFFPLGKISEILDAIDSPLSIGQNDLNLRRDLDKEKLMTDALEGHQINDTPLVLEKPLNKMSKTTEQSPNDIPSETVQVKEQSIQRETRESGNVSRNFEDGATSLLLQEERNATNMLNIVSVTQVSALPMREIQNRSSIPDDFESNVKELLWDPTLKCNLCDEMYQGLAFCELCLFLMCVPCCLKMAGICAFCGKNISVIIKTEEQDHPTRDMTIPTTPNNTILPKCLLCPEVPVDKVICPSCSKLLCVRCWKVMGGRCQPCERKFTIFRSSPRCTWDDTGEIGSGLPRCHICRLEYERSAICEKCSASICEACCITAESECPFCENSGFTSPLVLITPLEECPICFEPFPLTPQARVPCPQCNYTVCSTCFQAWRPECPFCRTDRR